MKLIGVPSPGGSSTPTVGSAGYFVKPSSRISSPAQSGVTPSYFVYVGRPTLALACWASSPLCPEEQAESAPPAARAESPPEHRGTSCHLDHVEPLRSTSSDAVDGTSGAHYATRHPTSQACARTGLSRDVPMACGLPSHEVRRAACHPSPVIPSITASRTALSRKDLPPFLTFDIVRPMTQGRSSDPTVSAHGHEAPSALVTRRRALFDSSELGCAAVRIPALLRCRNGRLVAFAEARHDGAGDAGRIDVIATTSLDSSAWSNPVVVAHGGSGTRGNPVPIEAGNGDIVLLTTSNGPAASEAEILAGTVGPGGRAARAPRPSAPGPRIHRPRTWRSRTR